MSEPAHFHRWPLLLLTVLLACRMALSAEATPLRIAAAADLQPVLPRLIELFSRQDHQPATASYASSSVLCEQIENGAPFDLFLSADTSYPERLIHDGLSLQSQPIPYARGTLVLWTRNDSGLPTLSPATLGRADVHTIAIANPGHAPYGRAAIDALTALHLRESAAPKLRIAENVAGAAQFASSGSAQVGLISLTSALTPALKAQGHYVEMPPSIYPPLLQALVTIKASPHQGATEEFLHFLFSPGVADQLRASGLTPAAPPAPLR